MRIALKNSSMLLSKTMNHFSLTSYATPVAILVAGVLIAGAVFWSSAGGSSVEPTAAEGSISDFRLPSEEDHVRGNQEAKVAIVEFSDFECPFCAQLHPTLARIIEENKDVKWLYRHFPLTSIHSRAHAAARASECAAKLGGNEAFWKFADAMFENQHRLGESLSAETANALGIEQSAFAACVSDSSISAQVDRDAEEAVQSGGRGTPFAVVVTASGKLIPFSGALPYEDIKRLVDQAIGN